jgi:hypothetical protein
MGGHLDLPGRSKNRVIGRAGMKHSRNMAKCAENLGEEPCSS